jgi:hypothetical protein
MSGDIEILIKNINKILRKFPKYKKNKKQNILNEKYIYISTNNLYIKNNSGCSITKENLSTLYDENSNIILNDEFTKNDFSENDIKEILISSSFFEI